MAQYNNTRRNQSSSSKQFFLFATLGQHSEIFDLNNNKCTSSFVNEHQEHLAMTIPPLQSGAKIWEALTVEVNEVNP